MNWVWYGYTAIGGAYSALTASTLVTSVLTYGDSYELSTFTWPFGDGGRTSTPEYFEINEDCKYTSAQIAWENEEGGTDYFTVRGNKMHNVNQSKATFTKQLDYQTDFTVGHTDSDRGETIFDAESQDEWQIGTGFITRQQVLDLEFLWKSKNAFVRFGTIWYPIIITNDSQTIEVDKNGLREYAINFVLANKKYIQ